MHTGVFTEARRPCLIGGEHQHRGEPQAQAAMQMVQHCPRGTTAQAVRPVAIDRVFAHVEIERRQIRRAEHVQRRDHPGPVIALHRRAILRVQLGQAMQHVAFQLRHFLHRHALGFGEARQRAQNPAHRVADAAIEFGLLLEDFRPDAQIIRRVGVHHPQAQNIRTILVGHFLWGGDIAERLAHLAAMLVEHEAMRQNGVERRATTGADRFKQARMEPAAMLVAAFQIQIGRPRQTAGFQREGVRRAALEPHIHNVHHLLILRRITIIAQEARGRGGIPCIGTLSGEGGDHTVHHRLITQHLTGLFLHEHRNRHAPGALTADAPIRARGDHRADAVAALIRHKMRRRNRVQRLLADMLLAIHADEPLRRGAVDQRSLRAPGMRVGMHQLAARQQRAGLQQRRTDRISRLVDMHAFEARREMRQFAVIGHRLRHVQPMRPTECEIVLAVAGGDVDKARALFGGDEIGAQQRHFMLIATAPQRMRADRADKLAAFDHMEDVVRLDLGGLAEFRQQREGDQQLGMRRDQRAFGHRIDMHDGVFDLRAIGHGAVGRHRPRRGGPDHHATAFQLRHMGAQNREADHDRGGGVIVIFDLRLGQRGLFHRRPHHRTQAAIQLTIHQEFADFPGNGGLGREIHRGITVRPIAFNAQTAEFIGLDAHPFGSIGAAFGAELQHRHLILVATILAVLLLDPPFDGQAVAVPTWNVMRVLPAHLARPVDDILEDLVQRVADVQMPVRIGRAIMQHERFGVFVLRAQLVPQAQTLPARQDRRLLLGQVAAHRKFRGGQKDGGAIILRLGGGFVGHDGVMRTGAGCGQAEVVSWRRASSASVTIC